MDVTVAFHGRNNTHASPSPEKYYSYLSETVSEKFLGPKKGNLTQNLYSEVRRQQYSTVHTRAEKTGRGHRGR